MFSSETLAAVLFISFCSFVFYLHANSKIEISTCTDDQNNISFIGPKEDLAQIRSQVPELRFSECSEKTYTNDAWIVLKYRINNHVIILQNASKVSAK